MNPYPDYIQRVLEEHDDLDAKMERLQEFLDSAAIVKVSEDDKRLLRIQLAAMLPYLMVLQQRLLKAGVEASRLC